ncbi:MAG: patatin-like phospholipase family protein [Candidatus Binatia bacterium]|nr:patatin-like phospholipase family protein [Candidatus Binatia bacterium]
MIHLPTPPTHRTAPASGDKVALILNGGGISAAAYEIGALAALDKAFGAGFCARTFDIYVGVSAGAVLASLGANAASPARLRQDILNDRDSTFNFRRTDVYGIDYTNAITKCWSAMRRLTSVLYSYRRDGLEFSLFDLIDVMQELLPSGLFSLGPFEKFLADALQEEDMCNDFAELSRELYIPAIDLDRGQRVVFGEEGERNLRISQAITASCAIPAFFRPYRIGERSFIDGAMGGHCHLDVAIEHGAKLLFIVNPLVPIDMSRNEANIPALAKDGSVRVADMGITFVGDQAVRILGRDRLEASLGLVASSHPDVQIVLIEPSRDEPLLFVHSPMSFEGRPRILQYAYDSTLRDLEVHGPTIRDLLSAHGHTPTKSPDATLGLAPQAVTTNVDQPLAGKGPVVR